MRKLLAIALLLALIGASAATVNISTIGANQRIGNSYQLYIDNANARVGVGTQSPQAHLDVNGTLRASGLYADVIWLNTTCSLNTTSGAKLGCGETTTTTQTATDMSGSDNGNWLSTDTIWDVSASNSTHVYLAASNGKLGVLDLTRNVTSELSGTDQSNWMGTSGVLTIDAYNTTAVYVGTATSAAGNFGVYNPATNTTYNITFSGIGDVKGLDAYNSTAVYLASQGGVFGRYNPVTNTTTDLSTTDNGDWIGATTLRNINAFNATAVYLSLNGGLYGVYNPELNSATDLTSTDPGNWMSTNWVYEFEGYNATAVYIVGAGGTIGVYNPVTNVTSDLTGTDTGNWIGTLDIYDALPYSATQVFLAIGSGKFGVYNPTTNVTTDLSSTDTANWIGSYDVRSMTSAGGDFYLGAGNGLYGHYYERSTTSTDGFTLENDAVGIGTAAPSTNLHVSGDLRVDTGHGYPALFADASTGYVGIGTATPGIALAVNGRVNASGTVSSSAGVDMAESFNALENMTSGLLVAAVNARDVVLATDASGAMLIGVVSTQPAMTLNDRALSRPVHIALAGRVPVNITGSITRGDFITASSTPGIGEAAHNPGFVLGKALEDGQDAQVMMLIQPRYFNPQTDGSGKLKGDARKTIQLASQNVVVQQRTAQPTTTLTSDVVVVLG